MRIKPRTWPVGSTLIALEAGILGEAVVSLKGALLALKPCGQSELCKLGGKANGQSFPQSPGEDLWEQIGRSKPACPGFSRSPQSIC